VAGVDAVRGIAFQQAQAILAGLDVLDDPGLGSMRVEGVADVVDIEVFDLGGALRLGKQAKVRAEGYTWGRAELVAVLRRWAALPDAVNASFEFVTDGRLGPTGQEVADALEAAGSGRTEALAAILGEDAGSAICAALSNARVRLDPSGVEALLARAERQVRAMLPDPRTAADARKEAEEAVNRLFRAMFVYAGDVEAQARILTRATLAQILGVPADQPVTLRWPGELRNRYLDAARSRELETFVPALVSARMPSMPLMRRSDGEGIDAAQPVSALLQGDGPSVLAGRTGMGKSTAGHLLRRDAARDARVVVVGHAEAYLPGRLPALAADSISEVLGEDLPASTGKQALNDRDVTFVIDGVSEVPDDVRQGLEDELRAPLAAGRGARIVLLGRDIAVLRGTLPSSRPPVIYHLLEFDLQRRLDLACRMLWGSSADDPGNTPQLPGLRADVARVDHSLGDAAGNPLLLSMALTLIGQGIAFTDRAGLYKGFIELLAARSGATGIARASAGLGIAFAALLDQGRRYADPIEWARLLGDAVAVLGAIGVAADVRSVDAAVRRSGLVTPLGWTQTCVPIHDSFADYLAGAAHANRLASFPPRMEPGDGQRVLFAAEIGGVDAGMAAQAAQDLPFLTVQLAKNDRRGLAEDAPAEIQQILRYLDPDRGYGVGLWRTNDSRVVGLNRTGEAPGWVDEATAREILPTTPAVIIDDPSPLKVAVRVWRQSLVLRLKPPETMPVPQPTSLDHARALLAEHAAKASSAIRDLIAAVAPPNHPSALTSQVGPTGLQAVIHASQQQFGATFWPVSYQRADTIAVDKGPDHDPGALAQGTNQNWRQSTFDGLTRLSPEADAVSRVRAAIEEMTVQSWLTP